MTDFAINVPLVRMKTNSLPHLKCLIRPTLEFDICNGFDFMQSIHTFFLNLDFRGLFMLHAEGVSPRKISIAISSQIRPKYVSWLILVTV